MMIRTITTLALPFLLATGLWFTPAVFAKTSTVYPPPSANSHTQSTEASITPSMPSQPIVAPTVNVYDESDALSPVDTRNLLALAAAFGIVGFLILEERVLYATLRRRAPYYPTEAPMRRASSVTTYSPGASSLGVGSNVPVR